MRTGFYKGLLNLSCAVRRRPGVIALSALMAIQLLVFPQKSGAAIFEIPDGDVASLMDAIDESNANGQDDVINLADNGFYEPESYFNMDAALAALPHITSNITINGNGSVINTTETLLTRVFVVWEEGVLTLNNLIIDDAVSDELESGAAILNFGTVSMTSCTIRNCRAGQGGLDVSFGLDGSDGGAIANIGFLDATSCLFQQNSAGRGGSSFTPGSGGNGGAIANYSSASFIDCDFVGNSAGPGGDMIFLFSPPEPRLIDAAFGGDGGAIANYGELQVSECTIDGNSAGGVGNVIQVSGPPELRGQGGSEAGAGGGIYNEGLASVSLTVISNNISGSGAGGSGGNGGGIFNSGEMFVSSCTIDSNKTGLGAASMGNGGGIYNGGSDGQKGQGSRGEGDFDTSIEIQASTISNNLASRGGGIANVANFLTYSNTFAENCTISGNSAEHGAINTSPRSIPFGNGGGVYNSNNFSFDTIATTDLRFCTIVNNSSTSFNGGGVVVEGSNESVITASHIILANNPSGNCSNIGGTFVSEGYNLQSEEQCCFTDSTDICGVDPLLGPLADNGGPTLTHLPLPGSPVSDAGDPNFVPPPAEDQRGFPRLLLNRVDLGAVEEFRDCNNNGIDDNAEVSTSSITVRSGDTSITLLAGPEGTIPFPDAFTQSDFDAAVAGPPAVATSVAGGWLSSLPSDPSAIWIGENPISLDNDSALYAAQFVVPNQAITSATLTFNWAVGDDLGAIPNHGVFLNGTMVVISGGEPWVERTLIINNIQSLLIPNAVNTLYVYQADVEGEAGVIFSATIDIAGNDLNENLVPDDCEANMAILKSATENPASVGDTFEYVLSAVNLGVLDSEPTTMTDMLPSGLTFISADPAPVSGPNPLVFAVPSIAPGEESSVTISLVADCSAIGSVENVATIDVATTDTDLSDNTSTATIDVVDDEPPTIECADSTVTVDLNCEWIADFDANTTVTDNCEGTSYTCFPAEGDILAVGTYNVQCFAFDASFNSSSLCQFTVNVVDNIPPVIVCPDDIVMPAEVGECSTIVNFSAVSITDNCDSGLSETCEPAGGSSFEVGETLVTCSVADTSGNTGTCTFTVTVTDSTSPELTCPVDIEVGTELGQCSAAVDFVTTVTDTCSTSAVTCDSESGATFPLGGTVVTCTAEDAAGNTASCSFTITVNDTQPPVVTCPSDIVQAADPGLCSTIVLFEAAATDNCDAQSDTTVLIVDRGEVSPEGIVCNPPQGVFTTGETVVTCTATDAALNTATCTFTVTVNDEEPPVVDCPEDIVVSNDPGECSRIVTFEPTASDNCTTVTVVSDPTSGTAFAVGVTDVLTTATDEEGNVTTCTFTVTVQDTEPPVITCPPDLSVDTVNCETTAVVTLGQPTVTDNCPETSFTASRSDSAELSDPFTTGVTTITYTAFDAAGNSATCQQTVTVTQAGCEECDSNVDLVAEDPQLIRVRCRTSRRSGITECSVQARVRTRNAGTESNFPTRTSFFLSDDTVFDSSDIFIGSKSYRAIRPGRSIMTPGRGQLPAGINAAGKYIIAVADMPGNNIECDELNNVVVVGLVPGGN